jgi:hypothetical protein
VAQELAVLIHTFNGKPGEVVHRRARDLHVFSVAV